jgi:hypothetical protein
VGSALDASRIVSGALDAVGNVIIFSLSEIDAKTLEPVARVQEEVSKDEAALLDATRRLSAELLKASHTATPKPSMAGRGTGGLDIGSDPVGATIVVDGVESGVTPASVNNLAPGRHAVQLKRAGYVTAVFDAPVSDAGTTKVRAELALERPVAEANFAAQQQKWGETELWRQAGGLSKVGCGVPLAVLGALLTLQAQDVAGTVILGTGTVATAGVAAWGVADLVTPTPAPVPDWVLKKTTTVTPPGGEPEVKVLQEGG